MNRYSSLALLLSLLGPVLVGSLGCMKVVCPRSQSRNPTNEIIQCLSSGYCGTYKGLRTNQQFMEAVDLHCRQGDSVFAPFDGEISFYMPLGDKPRSSCGENHGVRIDGQGQWRGYHVLMSAVKPFKFGGTVKAGAKIGIAGNLDCVDRSGESNFVRFQLFRHGKPVDPTHHLVDCMCTGQICETNRNNAIVGMEFKADARYNGVRGWELKCADVDPKLTSVSVEYDVDEEERKAPEIYSPIDGNVIGRIRLEHIPGESYAGCANEGIFVKGTGNWIDYEVRIYNARFRENIGLGQQRIEQGQHIGYRLQCEGSPDSVFIEVRFQGTVVDISEALSAKDCRHKTFSRLL